MNKISEITRRDIFDHLSIRNLNWNGRLSESDFLTRVFELEALPSNDYRYSSMLGDIMMHREHFLDWGDNWIFDDSRLNLLRGPDETFLRLLCEMIHPIVRPNEVEVDEL